MINVNQRIAFNPGYQPPAGSSEPKNTQIQDRYVATGEVGIPHPKPNFPKASSIETKAAQLHQQWEKRMGGQEKCVVGILCEREWNPQEEHDEVLDLADAVMDAGGLPKLLYIGAGDAVEQMKSINALMVPGGRDVDPAKYGQKLGPGMDPNEPDPAFDDFEIGAIRQAYASGMPLLGQCRGTQLMNVAGGGTLVQDIPTEFHSPEGWGSNYGTVVNHRPEAARENYAARLDPVHPVVIAPESRLAGLVGQLKSVNSIHHQCISAVSPILLPVAWALDGLVEGVERKGMPWQAGYQFHPEALRYTEPRFQGLYDKLVEDGAAYKNGQLPQPTAS